VLSAVDKKYLFLFFQNSKSQRFLFFNRKMKIVYSSFSSFSSFLARKEEYKRSI